MVALLTCDWQLHSPMAFRRRTHALSAAAALCCAAVLAAANCDAVPSATAFTPVGSVNVTKVSLSYNGEPLVRMGDSALIEYTVSGLTLGGAPVDDAAPAQAIRLWLFASHKQWGAPVPLAFTGPSSDDDIHNPNGGGAPPPGTPVEAHGSVALPLPNPSETTQIHGVVYGSSVGNRPPPQPQGAGFIVGSPLPRFEANGTVITFPPVTIAVTNDVPKRPAPRDPDHSVGLFWEPWFTTHNAQYGTAEAVPAVGQYDSFNPDVMRQHAIWFTELGIDWLGVDWTNNLWGQSHFSGRGIQAQEIINATAKTIEAYHTMRTTEGMDVPQFVLLLGLDNGPSTTLQAITEEMDWVAANIIAPYPDSAVMYEGKPLIVVFDGTGTDHSSFSHPKFTIRWMASQLQDSHFEQKGYWSWMDGSMEPAITMHGGAAEAVTVTPAFFAGEGWLGATAGPRNGGTTLANEVESVLARSASRTRDARGALASAAPRFLMVCQWNEYAGQPNGGGYGPDKNRFVDSYSPNLSNDLEPTSPGACAYARPNRTCGGYGWQPANLFRALLDQYRSVTWAASAAGPPFNSTLVLIKQPEDGAILGVNGVGATTLSVSWSTYFDGKTPPAYYIVAVERKTFANTTQTSVDVDVSALAAGQHAVTVTAMGAGVASYYPLSPDRGDTVPSEAPVNPSASAVVHKPAA